MSAIATEANTIAGPMVTPGPGYVPSINDDMSLPQAYRPGIGTPSARSTRACSSVCRPVLVPFMPGCNSTA